MAVVAVSTVFAYNLVRPLYDEVLRPESRNSSEHSQDPGARLIRDLDRVAAGCRDWLQPRVGGGTRALLLLALLAVAIKNACAFVARYAAARFGLATMRDLRAMLFDAMLGQSPAYFHRHPTGVLVARVVHDVELIREALAERFGDVIQDCLTLLLLAVYIVALSPRLAVATIILAPLLLAPALFLSRRLRRRSRQSQERMGELAALLDESVRGLMVVQSYGMAPRLACRFGALAEKHFRARLRARAIQAANAPVMEIVGAAAALALIGWAATQIAAGAMTLGDFSAFLVAAWGSYNPVKRINKFNLAVQQAGVAAERVFSVLDAQVAVRDRRDAVAGDLSQGGIDLLGVGFSYEEGTPVLTDLDLHVPAGETTALVGASGAGKTTLAQLIPRFHDADAGSVRIAGTDVRELTLDSLRAQIGLVTQETLLFDDTVTANIAAGAHNPRTERVVEAARLAFAADFINALPRGYDTVIGEAGVRLSGGQRQRIAIARALYKDPPILILDEATSNLDREAEQIVGRALGNLLNRRTTLLIAHRESTVRLADSIAVLDGGRVVEHGTIEDVVANGSAWMYDCQPR